MTSTMTQYEKQLYAEMQRKIANTRCKICHEPIGQKDHICFEERYFHTSCLRQSSAGQYPSSSRGQH
ncbi:MAG TPA: hypothetical protein PLG09_09760 [Syntrophomonadaceae bacterium]|nr:hypothetical protein [Syntrophomonadaceae bacterium]HOQ10395.1 hypothetical protein [Syntrophomonadaceae bacterium]HPU48268.1 hypothetical protein [Syntrophomonadaceae bacterium]